MILPWPVYGNRKVEKRKECDTETIGIEFNPKGAYRFFQFDFSKAKNDIIQLNDIMGLSGKQLEQQVANTEPVMAKIEVMQKFLINELMQNTGDLLFEFCVDKIISSEGKITVKELEKKTGYSSRWLNMKFIDNIGVSPKNLSSIIRFQECYQAFISENLNDALKNEYYEYYYDQSHFIKNFKHFTGLLPSGVEPSSNNFGLKYYRV